MLLNVLYKCFIGLVFIKKEKKLLNIDFFSPKSCWFNLIQDQGIKDPPTSFSPGTSTKVGNSPQNFMTFSFDSLATLL